MLIFAFCGSAFASFTRVFKSKLVFEQNGEENSYHPEETLNHSRSRTL